MVFEYSDYLRECFSQPMLVIMLVGALFLYMLCAAIRISHKEPRGRRLAWIPVLLLIPVLLGAPALPKQIGTLVKTNGFAILQDRGAEPVSLTGVIDAIELPERNADTRFTYDGEHHYGAWLTIVGERYFTITAGDLTAGDTVILNYLPKSRCVLYLAPAETTNAEE